MSAEDLDYGFGPKARTLLLAKVMCQYKPLRKLFELFPESEARYWAVVDFKKLDSELRLFIFDIENQYCDQYLVAHGIDSGGPDATVFSNEIGSTCSSLGVFKTGDTFEGEFGTSIYLDGLEPTNSNARARGIVIHKAPHVDQGFLETPRVKRSNGSFVVNPDSYNQVFERLKDGSYIIVG